MYLPIIHTKCYLILPYRNKNIHWNLKLAKFVTVKIQKIDSPVKSLVITCQLTDNNSKVGDQCTNVGSNWDITSYLAA